MTGTLEIVDDGTAIVPFSVSAARNGRRIIGSINTSAGADATAEWTIGTDSGASLITLVGAVFGPSYTNGFLGGTYIAGCGIVTVAGNAGSFPERKLLVGTIRDATDVTELHAGAAGVFDATSCQATVSTAGLSVKTALGVGTLAPARIIEAVASATDYIGMRCTGTASTAGVYGYNSTTGNAAQLEAHGSTVAGNFLGTAKAGGATLLLYPIGGAAVAAIGTSTSFPLLLGSNDVEQLRLTPSGKVVITGTGALAMRDTAAPNHYWTAVLTGGALVWTDTGSTAIP